MKKMVFVVLHYLTTDDTVECVSSIRRCCADGEYQIIIVDNASPNKSGKQLMEKYEKDKDIDLLILENNLGFARGNNVGIAYASRYVLTPVLTGLRNIPANIKKLAVVGTPCQIQALKLGGGKADLDIFTIGVTCSGGMSYKATEQYKKLQNMPISKMFYRGDGWPGKNCLISSDGNKIEYVHNGSLFERMFSSQIFKNPGCRGCKDHFAEQAEISFCDFWNAEERKTESEGNSCVIIRSARADEYFNKMQKLGFIEVVRDLDEKEVADTQMHALKAKKGKLHSSIRYHVFTKAIDYVFAHNLYERLGIREYNYFCKFYRKLCEKQKL